MAKGIIERVKSGNKKISLKYKNKLSEKDQILKVEEEGWWVYVLLLSTVVIFTQSLKNYTFSIDNIKLTYALLVLPLIYFITNYITKKYGYTKSIVAISCSGVSLILFSLLMSFVIGQKFNLYNVSGEFCGYVVSQFVNLSIYQFLLVNINQSFILIFLNYLFAFVVNYLFYTLIYMNLLVFDSYWVAYFLTLIIQGIISLLLTFVDLSIKRGIEI